MGFPNHLGVKIDISLSECSLIQKDTVQKLELEDIILETFVILLKFEGGWDWADQSSQSKRRRGKWWSSSSPQGISSFNHWKNYSKGKIWILSCYNMLSWMSGLVWSPSNINMQYIWACLTIYLGRSRHFCPWLENSCFDIYSCY